MLPPSFCLSFPQTSFFSSSFSSSMIEMSLSLCQPMKLFSLSLTLSLSSIIQTSLSVCVFVIELKSSPICLLSDLPLSFCPWFQVFTSTQSPLIFSLSLLLMWI